MWAVRLDVPQTPRIAPGTARWLSLCSRQGGDDNGPSAKQSARRIVRANKRQTMNRLLSARIRLRLGVATKSYPQSPPEAALGTRPAGEAHRVQDPDNTALLNPVLERVLHTMSDHAAAIAAETADAVHRRIADYRLVPHESLVQSALRNHARVARALREGRGPGEDDMIEEAWIVRERVRSGVPIENALHAYRLSISILRTYFTRWAVEFGLDSGETLRGVNALWEVTDVVTLRLAAVHRDEELNLARHDERQRFNFLHALLTGATGPNHHALCATYGLPVGISYVTLRARATAEQGLRTMTELVARTTRRAPSLIGIFEGDVAGVVATPPVIPERLAVAVGPAVDLADLPISFRCASQVLDVGLAFGMSGLLTAERLSLRLAVASADDVGALLVERYIAPTESETDGGKQLRESVRAYLAANRNVRDAATRLCVHPNTLRYRLRKFETMTGRDLSLDAVAFEAWWALQRWSWEAGSKDPRG